MQIAIIGDTHFPLRGSVLPAACLVACRDTGGADLEPELVRGAA